MNEIKEKRKNHYIPKMLLKNFSLNNNLNLYIIKGQKSIGDLPYFSQCQHDYFYGKDNKIEDELAKIESDASPVIQKIIDLKIELKLSKDEQAKLVNFISLLKVRTKSYHNQINNLKKEFIKCFNKLNIKNSQKFKEILDYKIEPSALVDIGKKNLEIYANLSIAVLKNTTNLDYVLTDNPVYAYNLFSEPNINKMSYLGMGDTGIILFIPVSSKTLILMYDSKIYQLNNNKNTIIKINNTKTIKDLNAYSILNCENLIYFTPCSDFCKQIKWLKNIKKNYTSSIVSGEIITINDIIQLKNTPSNFRLKLPFIKIKGNITSYRSIKR